MAGDMTTERGEDPIGPVRRQQALSRGQEVADTPWGRSIDARLADIEARLMVIEGWFRGDGLQGVVITGSRVLDAPGNVWPEPAAARSPEAGADTRPLSEQNAVLLGESMMYWHERALKAEAAEAEVAELRAKLERVKELCPPNPFHDDLHVMMHELRAALGEPRNEEGK